MNILILVDYYPPQRIGGVGELASALRDGYERHGHHVWVLSTGRRNRNEGERRIIRSHRSLFVGILINNFHAVRLIRKFHIDAVHLLQCSSTLFLLWPREPRPVVLTTPQVFYETEFAEVCPAEIGGHIFHPSWRERLEKYVFMPVHLILDRIGMRRADLISVLTPAAMSDLHGYSARVEVIPNPVAPSDQTPPELADDRLRAFIANRTVLLFVGVFRMRKRLPALLLAFREHLERQPDTVLLIVGGGRGYDSEYRRLASRLGLLDHVWFAGAVPQGQVVAFIALADVYCMVSSYEGMPIALLEAMAYGVAVIGTRIPGVEAVVEHGRTGLLVDVDDVHQLGEAITLLVQDKQLRQRMGRAAADIVRERFGTSEISRQYVEHLLRGGAGAALGGRIG